MSDFKPFKLFKLPSLAYEQIVLKMGLVEIFNISICSEKATETLKQVLKPFKKYYSLAVEFDDSENRITVGHLEGAIEIVTRRDSEAKDDDVSESQDHLTSSKKNCESHSRTLSEVAYTRTLTPDKIRINFKDQTLLDNFKLVVEYLKNLFRVPTVTTVILNADLPRSIIPSIIDYLDNPKGSVQSLIAANLNSKETMLEFLQHFSGLKYLEFVDFHIWNSSTSTLHAHPEALMPNQPPVWELEEMKIFDAMNISLTRIFHIKCQYLTIENLRMPVDDNFVYGYLKKWVNGDLPWIKHLTILIFDPKVEESLAGIKYTKNDKRVLNIGSHNKTEMRELNAPTTAYDIQGNAGYDFCPLYKLILFTRTATMESKKRGRDYFPSTSHSYSQLCCPNTLSKKSSDTMGAFLT